MNTHKILNGLGRSGLQPSANLEDPRTRTTSSASSSAASGPPSSAQRRQSTQSARRRMSSSIRHSNVESFEFDPLMAAVQARKEKQRRRERERELDESTKSSSTANDLDDVLIHDTTNEKKERVKEAGQLAELFLEIRKGVMDTHNVPSTTAERPSIDQQQERIHTRASKTTLQRAEKTKVMLNLHYFSLFQSQKHMFDSNKFEGVDGVYNPLQIIRNRRVRKKFHQPPQLSIKTIPAASEAFSKKKGKLIWQVDLAELAHDLNWRTQHWHDLVNPRGELWFPPTEEHHNHRGRSNKDNGGSDDLTNMHDRLFQLTDEESSKDDLLDVPRSRKRDIIADKIRRRSKSPFKRDRNNSSSYNDLSKVSDEPPQIETTPPTPQEHQSTTNLGLLNDISIEPVHAHERVLSNMSSSDIGVGGSGPTSAHHTRDPSMIVSTAGLTNSLENSASPSADYEYEEYKAQNDILKTLKMSQGLSDYGYHSISNKRAEYQKFVNYNRLFADYKSSEDLVDSLKADVLTNYDNSLKEKSKRLQHIQDELTTEYSTRVDKLLLLSDRTIGEVNTTLALEARKLTERYEKLGPLHRRKDALVWFAYWLLENFVVLVLWMVWIGFSFGRLVKFFVMALWALISWLMR